MRSPRLFTNPQQPDRVADSARDGDFWWTPALGLYLLQPGAGWISLHTLDETGGAAAISVTSQELSVLLNGASARTTTNASVHGLQSIVDALSGRISQAGGGGGGGSVTSTEASNILSVANAASAAAAALSLAVSTISTNLSQEQSVRSAADAALSVRIDTVSNLESALCERVSSLSGLLSVEILNRTSADNILCNAISQEASVRSVLSDAHTSLVNRVSANSVQVSVTSTELSAVSAQAASALSAALNVSVKSAGGTSVKGLQSILNTLSNRISGAGGGGGSVTSTELSQVSAQAASALSAALNVSVQSGATSVHGLQSILNTLSNKVSIVSQAASAEISNRISADNAVSAQAASALSAALNVSVQSAGTSVKGLQSILNTLSNRISAGGGGGGSVTSTEVSAVSAQAASAISDLKSILQASISVTSAAVTSVDTRVSNALSAISTISQAQSVLSQAVSVLSQAVSVLSVAVAGPQTRVVDANQRISQVALTNITSLSVSMDAGGLYQLQAFVMYNRGNASAPVRFGMTFPAQARTRGQIMATASAVPGSTAQTVSTLGNKVFWTGDSASGSVLISLVPGSITMLSCFATYGGVFKASATGVLQLQAAASTGTADILILAGSYIQLFRIA